MNPVSKNSIVRFPMGPKLRSWLSVPEHDYKGHENTSPTAEDVAMFTDAFLLQLEDSSPNNSDQLVDLLEELVGMNLPLLAIKLADAYPEIFPQNDFRAQLYLGNASMLVNDFSRAESAFVEAQKLVPQEPAPYVNLTQIYCHDGLIERARQWCEAGLNAENNNLRLWELMAWIEQQTEHSNNTRGTSAIDAITALAKSKNSWAGVSLACDLKAPEDVIHKATELEKFWDEGLRDPEFLTEFTAVLGMAGRYDRIPSIIWQAEKQSSTGLPWQLTVHLIQAYLGLGREEDAARALNKLSHIETLPKSAQQILQSLQEEISSSQSLS